MNTEDLVFPTVTVGDTTYYVSARATEPGHGGEYGNVYGSGAVVRIVTFTQAKFLWYRLKHLTLVPRYSHTTVDVAKYGIGGVQDALYAVADQIEADYEAVANAKAIVKLGSKQIFEADKQLRNE